MAAPGGTMEKKLLTCILGVIPDLTPAWVPGLGAESLAHLRKQPGGCEGHVGVLVLPMLPPGLW